MKRKNFILTTLVFLFISILGLAVENPNPTTQESVIAALDPDFAEGVKEYKPNLENIDKMFNYIEKLNSIEQFKVLKEENEKIVFVFSATWCPDCIMLDHYLEETINKFPEIKFIYVNRDDYPEIAQALDIFGIPSFVGYKNNVEVSRFVSRLAKTQKEVEEFLEKI